LKISPDDKTFEIRELEQQKIILQALNKYLTENENISNEVFDSLSHELRTPMAIIKTNSDMLIMGKFGNLTQAQQETLKEIKVNTNLLMNAVFKMLEKSKKRQQKEQI